MPGKSTRKSALADACPTAAAARGRQYSAAAMYVVGGYGDGFTLTNDVQVLEFG